MYSSLSIVMATKLVRMKREGYVARMRELRNGYIISVRKPATKKLPDISRRKWENNITLDLT